MTKEIIAAEDRPMPAGAREDAPATWGPAAGLAEKGVRPEEVIERLPDDVLDMAQQAYAVVNHSRWVVRCPFCPSAQLAAFTDRRFWCPECEMEAIGGKWVEVVWPDDADEIASVLSARPPANRNWAVGESPVLLLAENERNAAVLQPKPARPVPPGRPERLESP